MGLVIFMADNKNRRRISSRLRSAILFSTPLTIFLVISVISICYSADNFNNVLPGSVSPQPGAVQMMEKREKDVEAEKKAKEGESEGEKKVEAPQGVTFISGRATKIKYLINVNDKLYVSVWRVPDLSMEIIVRPDGYMSFPLIGDIEASGRTLTELKDEITAKLKEYVENPQVSLVVKEFAGEKVVILGEVRSPGVYKFTGKVSLMEGLGFAGGFTRDAQPKSIIVVRSPVAGEEKEKLIVLNAASILQKGNLKENIELEPNDIIFVSRSMISNVKEFYNDFIVPVLRTAVDYETFRSIRQTIKAGHAD